MYMGVKYNLTESGEPYPQYILKLYEISIGALSGLYLPLLNKIYNGTGDITNENWATIGKSLSQFT